MHEPPHIRCRLIINEKDERVVTPRAYLSRDAIVLRHYPLAQRWGPCFHIALLFPTLADMLTSAAGGTFVRPYPAEHQGMVDENEGYGANDLGPHSRKIVALKVGVCRSGDATVFSLAGRTEPVDPMTVFYPIYHDTSTLSPDQVAGYVFQLSFEIADDEITLHSKDKDVLDAMRAYVDAAVKLKAGAPGR